MSLSFLPVLGESPLTRQYLTVTDRGFLLLLILDVPVSLQIVENESESTLNTSDQIL